VYWSRVGYQEEWNMPDLPLSNEQPVMVIPQGKLYKPGDSFKVDGRTFILGEAKRIEPGENFAFEMHLPPSLKLVKATVTMIKITMSEDAFNDLLAALTVAEHAVASDDTRARYQNLRDSLQISPVKGNTP
jgi:hypothetical protein